MLKFSFTTTKEQSAELIHFIRYKARPIILKENNETKFLSYAKAGLLTKLFYWVLFPWFSFINHKNQQSFAFPTQITLIFDDDCIQSEGAVSNKVQWFEIKRAIDGNRFLVLFSLNLIVALPKRVVESDEVYDELLNLIEQQINSDIEIEVIK